MKKYKFTFDQLAAFANYLTNCIIHAKTKEQNMLGSLIHCNLVDIRDRCAIKLMHWYIKTFKTAQLTFVYRELLTLSYCFKQWETPAFLKGIEFNLIGAL